MLIKLRAYVRIPDYYVKVCVLIQNKVVKSKKTEVMKRSTSPVFNESFTYKLNSASLDTASVTITAMHYVSGHRGTSAVLYNCVDYLVLLACMSLCLYIYHI